MKLYSAQIFVENITKARHFYSRVLKLRLEKKNNAADSLVYVTGAARIVVTEASKHGAEAALIGRFTGLTLAVKNLDAIYKRTGSNGAPFVSPPRAMDSGAIVASIRDPSHNVLTLLQPR